MAVEVCFDENETFQILWALSDAIDLAEQVDALSSVAMLDGIFRMVRRRFEERREK